MSAPRGRGRPSSRTTAAASSSTSRSASAATAAASAASGSSSTPAPPGPSSTSSLSRPTRLASTTPGPAGSSATSTSSLLARGTTPTQSMVPSRGAFRGGVRMTFRPVAPVRRKMADSPEVKTEPGTSAGPSTSTPPTRGGLGRGRGDGGRGRGRGRGGVPEMVASGPFAMGTGAISRSEARKRAQTSGGSGGGFAPPPGTVSASTSAIGLKSEGAAARSKYRDPDRLKEREDYSDPEDEGVDIIDMDDVQRLDELAPSTLPRIKEKEKKKKNKDAKAKKKESKTEAEDREQLGVGIKDDPEAVESKQREALTGASPGHGMSISPSPSDDEKDDGPTADALDLSESEEEEIMDDLVDDFVLGNSDNEEEGVSPENRLYLFQFPKLFPKFVPAPPGASEEESSSAGGTASAAASGSKPRRSVAFAEDTAGGGGMAGTPLGAQVGSSSRDRDSKEDLKVKLEEGETKPGSGRMGPEGQIGRLEVYRDGRVNLRFGDIVLEVTGGSQSTFLQQVMVMDEANSMATTLGEVQRKFVVSPEIQNLLDDAQLADEEEAERRREQAKGKGNLRGMGSME